MIDVCILLAAGRWLAGDACGPPPGRDPLSGRPNLRGAVMLDLLHTRARVPEYAKGPTPWSDKHYHVVYPVEPIDPHRMHAFRPTLQSPNCSACQWPQWHTFHQLRGRQYPYKGARVRLLSVPEWCMTSALPAYRRLRPGAEGTVAVGPKWYPTVYGSEGLFGHNLMGVKIEGAELWVAARTLLVLK